MLTGLVGPLWDCDHINSCHPCCVHNVHLREKNDYAQIFFVWSLYWGISNHERGDNIFMLDFSVKYLKLVAKNSIIRYFNRVIKVGVQQWFPEDFYETHIISINNIHLWLGMYSVAVGGFFSFIYACAKMHFKWMDNIGCLL